MSIGAEVVPGLLSGGGGKKPGVYHFQFEGEIEDRHEDHGYSDDPPDTYTEPGEDPPPDGPSVNLAKYKAKITIVKAELVKIPTEHEDGPELENGRICINAQDEYKKAKWKVSVMPEKDGSGNDYTAGVKSTAKGAGTCKVTFAGIGASNPTALKDGEEFWAVGGKKVGEYEITLTHNQCPECADRDGEYVFKFVLKIEDGVSSQNPPSVAPGMGEFYQNYLKDYSLGTAVEISYMKQSRMFTRPHFADWGFRVRTRFQHRAMTGLRCQFRGRSKGDSWWPAVAGHPAWKTLVILAGAVGGKVPGAVGGVLTVAMKESDNGRWQFTACGVGKPAFDVDGKAYGVGTDHKETKASVERDKLNDRIPVRSIRGPITPVPPPPKRRPNAMSHYRVSVGSTGCEVDTVYNEGRYRDIHFGYAFAFDSSGTYKWRYDKWTPNLFNVIHIYRCGGIDICEPKTKQWDWVIEPSDFFEIISDLEGDI